MRLGFAVKVLGGGGCPPTTPAAGSPSPHLRVSLDRSTAILGYLDGHDIRMYRMATALAPYASHPDLPRFRDQPARFTPSAWPRSARARASSASGCARTPASTPS